MNKILIGLLSFASISTNAATIYDCRGGSFDPVKVEVQSSSKIIINDKDVGVVNSKELADASKKVISLIGNFSTLGDGTDGYPVDVKVTRYLLNKSKMAYLNTYNRGPEGFSDSDSYKCIKR